MNSIVSILSNLRPGVMPNDTDILALILRLFYKIDVVGIKTIMLCISGMEKLLDQISRHCMDADDDQSSFKYCPSKTNPIDKVDILVPILNAIDERTYVLPFINCDKDNQSLQLVERFLLAYSTAKYDIDKVSYHCLKKLILLPFTTEPSCDKPIWFSSHEDLSRRPTIIKTFFETKSKMLLRNVPLLLPYVPYIRRTNGYDCSSDDSSSSSDDDDNNLPRCSNPDTKFCLRYSKYRIVRFMCECSKQFYCSEECREECYKDHYIYCNEIRFEKKNQQKSIVSSKKPLNEKASSVVPFITVSETWITSLSDLWSLGATCKLFQASIHHYRHAKRIIDTNLERLVKPFGFKSLLDFNSLLTKSGCILGGSMPLQAIIGKSFFSSDTDLYVRSTSDERDDDTYYRSTIHTMLQRFGWTKCDDSDEYDSDYIEVDRTLFGIFVETEKVNLRYIPGDDLNIFSKAVCLAVYSYKYHNGRKIQVIVVNKVFLGKTNNLGSIVYHYDFSFLCNYYNGIKFRMIYPYDAIARVGHFNKDMLEAMHKTKRQARKMIKKITALGTIESMISNDYLYYKLEQYQQKVLSRMDKYISRGFTFVGPQPPRGDIRHTKFKLW